MMKPKLIPFAFLLCICNAISAQDSSVFSFQDFYSQVVNYHPVSKQANLLTQSAKSELMAARGAFDPVISTNYENKTTDGKNSYITDCP